MKLKQPNYIKKFYPFIITAISLFLYLLPLTDMCSVSGDAYEIWKTIKTYGTENMHATYVLYKGLFSIYPYIWLYRLSVLFSVNEWLFIKLFYSLAFSYITTLGLPNMVEYLTSCKVKQYQRILMAVVCCYFWIDTGALTYMLIDIPSFMYFLFLVNSALKGYKEKTISVKRWFWMGIWIGINLCSSGQYTMPTICIIIFVVVSELKKHGYQINKILSNKWIFIRNSILIIIPAFVIKVSDNVYLEKVVGGLRENGAWIPSGDDWLQMGLTRFMHCCRAGAEGTLYANRNIAIYADYLGIENFNEMYHSIIGGGWSLSILEYLQIFIKYPVDFILCYLDKFFIMLSPDKGGFNFLPLFVFYTCTFIAIYIGLMKCSRWKDVFNIKFWIGFAFLWSIVPSLVMVVEMRCSLQIQGIILAVTICTDFIWEKLKNIFTFVREKRWNTNFLEGKISKSMLVYAIFIVFCFMHMASIYSTVAATDFEQLLDTLISL